jgi:hypothetical protein
MKWLAVILKAFFEAIFGFIKKDPKTLEVGESGGEFEDKVKEQIDDQIPDGPGGSK